jgi:hypothetical protein
MSNEQLEMSNKERNIHNLQKLNMVIFFVKNHCKSEKIHFSIALCSLLIAHWYEGYYAD